MALKKSTWSWVVLGVVACFPSFGLSYPTLQLDIEGGWYNQSSPFQTDQTIVAPSSVFKLYAFLIPNQWNTLDDTYYISAALVPKPNEGQDLGYFTFDSETVRVTHDMNYGVPPLEAQLGFDARDLSQHGVFETYFKEFEFRFNDSNQMAPYDTAKRAKTGGTIPSSGSGMYYMVFNVDVSGLAPGYLIHFDLYNKKLLDSGDVDVSEFAPFSHDAESPLRRVPEPSTIVLLGGGLFSLAMVRRKMRN